MICWTAPSGRWNNCVPAPSGRWNNCGLHVEAERQLEDARADRDRLEEARVIEVEGLSDELQATKRELQVASQALVEAAEELAVTKERLASLGGGGDPSGEGRESEVSGLITQVGEMRGRLDEADDLLDRSQWEMEHCVPSQS